MNQTLAHKSRNKTNELKAYFLLRAAIYLLNSLVKKSDFGLIAAALKRAVTVLKILNENFGSQCQCGGG